MARDAAVRLDAPVRGRATDPAPHRALHGQRAASYWNDVARRFLRQRVAVAAAALLVGLLLAALLAPVLAPYDPIEQYRREGLSPLGAPLGPNGTFWLGTDQLGRDMLSRLLWGGRTSLFIGLTASAIAMAIALLAGGAAGFVGGGVDFGIMRFVDLIMSAPTFFLMLLLIAIFQPGAWVVIVVVSLFSWTYPARVFRSQILSLREQDYVLAARSVGVPGPQILLRHVLPHVLPLVIVSLALSIPTTVFAEASLSFIGLGVPPPNPSWGSMIQDGSVYYRAAPWIPLFPGLAIMLTVMSFNLVGTGLREAMDPTRRGR